MHQITPNLWRDWRNTYQFIILPCWIELSIQIFGAWPASVPQDMENSALRAILNPPLARTRRINSTTMASSSKYRPVAHSRSKHGDTLWIFIVVPRFGRDWLRFTAWPRDSLPGPAPPAPQRCRCQRPDAEGRAMTVESNRSHNQNL